MGGAEADATGQSAPSLALIDNTKFAREIGSNLARRTRQSRSVLLRYGTNEVAGSGTHQFEQFNEYLLCFQRHCNSPFARKAHNLSHHRGHGRRIVVDIDGVSGNRCYVTPESRSRIRPGSASPVCRISSRSTCMCIKSRRCPLTSASFIPCKIDLASSMTRRAGS